MGVPDNLQSSVIFPVAHNFLSAIRCYHKVAPLGLNTKINLTHDASTVGCRFHETSLNPVNSKILKILIHTKRERVRDGEVRRGGVASVCQIICNP